MKQQTYLVALGGNLPSSAGAPEATLRKALAELEVRGLDILRVSRFFRTPCFPAGTGPDYVNAAAVVSTALAPREVLDRLHEIEADFGRARIERWGMRTLDLDLLAAGEAILPDLQTYKIWRELPPEVQKKKAPSELILPHPRLAERAFVLVPLADVAPDWKHPVLGTTVAEMLAALPEAEKRAAVPLK